MPERKWKLTLQTRITPVYATTLMPHDIPPCFIYLVKQDVKVAPLLRTCCCLCTSCYTHNIQYIPLSYHCRLPSLATACRLNPRCPFDFTGVTHARHWNVLVIHKLWLSSGKVRYTSSVSDVLKAHSQRNVVRMSLFASSYLLGCMPVCKFDTVEFY